MFKNNASNLTRLPSMVLENTLQQDYQGPNHHSILFRTL
jgi:hypothetical protein